MSFGNRLSCEEKFGQTLGFATPAFTGCAFVCTHALSTSRTDNTIMYLLQIKYIAKSCYNVLYHSLIKFQVLLWILNIFVCNYMQVLLKKIWKNDGGTENVDMPLSKYRKLVDFMVKNKHCFYAKYLSRIYIISLIRFNQVFCAILSIFHRQSFPCLCCSGYWLLPVPPDNTMRLCLRYL